MLVHRSPKQKTCLYYTAVLVIVNVLLLSSLSTWLKPTPEQWHPKHLLNKPRKRGVFVQKFPSTRSSLNRTLRVLFWTPLFGDPAWAIENFTDFFSSCPVSDCVVTNDKSDIVKSDAVLFHAMDLWNKFMGYPLPVYRRPDQVWVLHTQEPPPHMPNDFRKYNGAFNWTASYRTDSDVPVPYLTTEKLAVRKPSAEDIASTKSAGIAWVASNCGDDARRQMLVREINKYYPVDIYGKCGDKMISWKDYTKILKKYKFYLSFENSYCRDYITEKFASTLHLRLLPIVSGGGDYKSTAPPRSYIHVSDFASSRDLVDYLRYLEKNTTAYNSYFEWTKSYKVESDHKRGFCKLCETLHDRKRPSQVYTDLEGYIEDDTCEKWTLSRYITRNVQGYAIKFGFV